MTQEQANDRFQDAVNRAKRLAVDIAQHAQEFDNGTDVTATDVDNFCSQLDDYETDIHSISDDAYVINDEGISEEEEEEEFEDEEDIDETVFDDDEYQDTADLRPSDADKDEAEKLDD